METRTASPLIGGRYRVEGLLGEGGMARVFDAFDERLERPVAVKVLRAETQSIVGMRQRFQQEALIAARLIHPHIVAVLDFGEDGAMSYLVMERLPGSTLRDEIVARGPLSTRRAALVMAETLSALSAAHRFGVLHRDIKPSNILLQEDGHTKITDFGIAKSFDLRSGPDRTTDDMTMTGFVLGTPGYLAPERRSGCPATVQSDLYAAGAVMVEALTGQRLGPDLAPADMLAPPLGEVARQAMATDPQDRFTSANEMLQSLRTAASRTMPATRAPAPPREDATTVAVPVAPAPPRGGTVALPSRGGRVALTSPRSSPPRRRSTRTRRRRRIVVVCTGLVLAAAAVILLEKGNEPSQPAASATQHHVAQQRKQALIRATPPAADAEGSAIRALATSLANGALPGDGALAAALVATAAQQPGVDRQSSAQQVLSLAQVLLAGGGISDRQYQDVVNALQPTGATVTTTTTSTTPQPGLPGLLFPGHGHGDGGGDAQGVNG